MRITALAAAGVLAGATFAHAHEDGVPSETLAAYAAMSKLEANKAEAAGAVMLAAIPDLPASVREEAAEDYASDLAQMNGYIEALQGMELDAGQADAIAQFATLWGEASAEGAQLIEAATNTPEFHARAFDWWESLDGLDDLIDDALEEILEVHGVEFADD